MTGTLGGIAGYAALYGRSTVIGEAKVGYGFRETLQAGAFATVLADHRTYAAFNHDPTQLLARVGAGNLRLTSDSRGLRYELDLPETTLGRDLGWMVARGMVPGSSFAFRVAPGGDVWTIGKDGMDERTILRVERLIDVSPVTSPAYEATATEGALAPVAARRSRPATATALDRKMAEVLLAVRIDDALHGQGLGRPPAVRGPARGSERRLVPVGAVERRYVGATVRAA